MAFGLGSFLANFASWFGMKSSNEQLPHEPAAADPAPINQEVAAADPVGPAVGPAEGHGLPEGAAAGADEVSNEEAGEEAEASSEEKKAVEEEEELQFQEAAEARFGTDECADLLCNMDDYVNDAMPEAQVMH